ncbi:MAG TPA: hypothetical protein IAC03_06165 [Candidatus Coprenecus pullistercoris]|nr:hypothetical protein [Candidatus Coprenecus pullistercoris]
MKKFIYYAAVLLLCMGTTVSCGHGGSAGVRYDRNYIVGEWSFERNVFYFDGREIAMQANSICWYTTDGNWYSDYISGWPPFPVRFDDDGYAYADAAARWTFENGKVIVRTMDGELAASWYLSEDGYLCEDSVYEILGYFFPDDSDYDVHYPEDISTLIGYDGNSHEFKETMRIRKTGN